MSQVKEFYSKVCVAGSFNFVTDKEIEEEISLSERDKFSCNLATILARDREVVAVNKNFTKQVIKEFVTNLSKDAPMSFVQASKRKEMAVLYFNIMEYCSVKLRSRLDKLKRDIKYNKDESYIKSFLEFAVINVDKLDEIDEYLGLLREGSYAGAVLDIANCACKEKYKTSFSCIDLHLLDPIIVEQPISSWNDIHNWIENNEFIAVSKKICYLCKLYIKFLRSKGYKITISGAHKKLYHRWKLPDSYMKEFVAYKYDGDSADSDDPNFEVNV
ncbi:hypothetical protein GLOIN_2v1762039 [Rhizophagus clarus]|uniref:Uncharacterized protein n=1 Tax=Rhizophagus clarus TaxID=94130 RepID=A0A8H3LCP7_9GLOM|nr:hypothetical protein GLOIN_2v1762039 [Rhizophagus clarus]